MKIPALLKATATTVAATMVVQLGKDFVDDWREAYQLRRAERKRREHDAG